MQNKIVTLTLLGDTLIEQSLTCVTSNTACNTCVIHNATHNTCVINNTEHVSPHYTHTVMHAHIHICTHILTVNCLQ